MIKVEVSVGIPIKSEYDPKDAIYIITITEKCYFLGILISSKDRILMPSKIDETYYNQV